jgi:hypothetical protein
MPISHTFSSKTIEGASFVLASPGTRIRNRAEYELSEERHQQTMIAQEQFALIPAEARVNAESLLRCIQALTPEQQERLDILHIRKNTIDEIVRTEYAARMLQSFVLPGEAWGDITDAALLLEHGPVRFTNEILDKAQELWEITNDETKNSSRPSTSPAPVDGRTNQDDGTVTTAKSEKTTESATVA